MRFTTVRSHAAAPSGFWTASAQPEDLDSQLEYVIYVFNELGTRRLWLHPVLDSSGYKASLEMRTVYVSMPDAAALKHGHVRVVDESGEDYLYPKSLFLPITVSASLRKAILKAA